MTNVAHVYLTAMCGVGIFGYLLVLLAFVYSWNTWVRFLVLAIAIGGQWAAMTPFVAWISDSVSNNI